MTATKSQPGSATAHKAAFEFVQFLAQELSSGKVDLPSFPDIAIKVRKALADDIREVYSEAKGTGFDTKIMRQVIRLRKMESADRQEQEAMLDLYLSALIELGLVLFLMTFILNGLARILIVATERGGGRPACRRIRTGTPPASPPGRTA